MEIKHFKAHRTEKDKKEMSHFEKFVTDGNEKADELAVAGAMLDEGFMAQTRAETVQQVRSFCSTQPVFIAQWRNGKTVKNSSRSQKESGQEKRGNKASNRMVCCCQEVSMHQVVEDAVCTWKMQRNCAGPKYLSNNLGKWRKRHLGRHENGKKNVQGGRSFDLVHKMFGLCETENGTELVIVASRSKWAREDGKMLKRILVLEDGRIAAKEARNWNIEGQQ